MNEKTLGKRAVLKKISNQFVELFDSIAEEANEREADLDYYLFFVEHLFSALELYKQKNYGTVEGGTKGYRNCWAEDGLDGRATFVELSAKYHRLKHMVWGEQYKTVNPLKIYTELRDMLMYILFTMYRLHQDRTLGNILPAADALDRKDI